MGFPEKAPSSYELETKITELNTALADTRSKAQLMGIAGIAFGLLGLGIGTAAWMASRRNASASDKRPPRSKM